MLQLRILRRRPHVALVPIAVAGMGALTTRPSFIPITILLSLVQAYTQVLAKRSSNSYIILLSLFLGLATSVAHISTARDALSSAATSFLSLLLLSSFASLVAVSAIIADASLRRQSQVQHAEVVLFPAIWVTAWLAIAHLSPLGWLTTWSPVIGTEAYAWMRPVFGSWGLMWVMAAWSQALGMIVLEAVEEDEEPPLITIENTDGQLLARRITSPARRHSAIALAVALFVLSVPSYFDRDYPLPSTSPTSTPLTVACVLPPSSSPWKDYPRCLRGRNSETGQRCENHPLARGRGSLRQHEGPRSCHREDTGLFRCRS